MAKKLYVIDASSNAYRAFYALPALANASGVPTHATLGFVTMLQKVLREHSPDAVAVAPFSASATFRGSELSVAAV